MILDEQTATFLESLQDFELAMEALCLCPSELVFATSDWIIVFWIDPSIFIPEV
jgi:hypothetical protein